MKCKHHGHVSSENVAIRKVKNSFIKECRICKREQGKRSRAKNLLLHKEYLKTNAYETMEIRKTCKIHGELKREQIKSIGGLTKCKLCMVLKTREYEKRYPERHENYKKEYSKRIGKILKRRRAIVSTHKISLEEYEELLNKSNHVCNICGAKETIKGKTGETRPLCVDHCHYCEDNNKYIIRGLLCTACNVGISRFKDNIDLLQSAITYLRKHEHT